MEAELLKQILAELKAANNREPLGFFSAARTFVYLNRTKCDGYLWYTRDNDINTGIPDRSLRGIIQGFAWETVERKERPTTKVRVRIKADRDYVLEAGLDSNAGQSLVKSLYALGKSNSPIVLSVSPGTSESVMFVGISHNGQRIKTEQGEVDGDMLAALTEWYPDKLFYSDSDTAQSDTTQSDTTQSHPTAHYTKLFDRLSEIGVTHEWVEWTKGLIAQRRFSPSSLTYEQAKEIFLFVKAKLQSPS